MSALTLAGDRTRADVVIGEGARIQSLVDLASGRELLYQGTPSRGPRAEFMTDCPGGWDELFPNDTPWRGHPDHGIFWSTQFEPAESSDRHAVLVAELPSPALSAERRVTLLPPPRCGVRVEMAVTASKETGPFLWASHPMLAVGEGWRIELLDARLDADDEMPGRFEPGEALEGDARAFVVPAPGEGWAEVLYASGPAAATVSSPDGRRATRVAEVARLRRHPGRVWVTGARDGRVPDPCGREAPAPQDRGVEGAGEPAACAHREILVHGQRQTRRNIAFVRPDGLVFTTATGRLQSVRNVLRAPTKRATGRG